MLRPVNDTGLSNFCWPKPWLESRQWRKRHPDVTVNEEAAGVDLDPFPLPELHSCNIGAKLRSQPHTAGSVYGMADFRSCKLMNAAG
jgi:hypothetical protein